MKFYTIRAFRLAVLIWIFSINSIWAQTYSMGILPGEDAKYKKIPAKTPLTRSFYEGAPRSFSLKKYAPIPGNQTSFGTCTGWAVGYAARTILEAQKNNWTDKNLITQNAFSPTFQYRCAESRESCEGAYTSFVVESLKLVGSVPMKDFYVPTGTDLCPPSPVHTSNHAKATKFRIEEFTTLWTDEMTDLQAKISRTKTSLSEGNPTVISMICPISFNKSIYNGLWTPTESPGDNNNWQHGRHALCVVGYDDDKFGGAFEIQNSWGTNWGNQGYVWIKYDDFARFVYQAFELVQFPKSSPGDQLLSGSLRLYDMDDKIFLPVELATKTRNWNVSDDTNVGEYTYKVTPGLLSGSKMRIYLKSNQPAYVYMLGTGSVDKSINKLFPVDLISPILNYEGNEVAIPSESHYFEMDDTIGEDYILLFFSKKKLDIEGIKEKLGNETGHISQRLKKTIGNDLIDSQNITFSSNEISFQVNQNSGMKDAFAMIIRFDHVKK